MSSSEMPHCSPYQPPTKLFPRLASVTGKTPVVFQPVSGGWTLAARGVVGFADGSRAFVKAATDENTARWLRAEQHLYTQVRAPFMPAFLGWHDDGERPVLLLEDLSDAFWPPPWSPERIELVLSALQEVHETPPPPNLPRLEAERDNLASWTKVAADPDPFLALGLCPAGWLRAALPILIAAEQAAVLDGDDLLHLDTRSDNLCFRENRAVLVDWNWACRGNGTVDIAGWVSSLHVEGGPPPEVILPGQPALAALFAGYWAFRAGLPPPQPGSRVREVQQKQLQVALPWAARALGLEAPF